MDNKDLNKEIFDGILSFDNEEQPNSKDEPKEEPTPEMSEASAESEVPTEADEQENDNTEQEEYDLTFSENITDDLLSEIFDDEADEKKKKKKQVSKKKKTKKQIAEKNEPEKKKTFLTELFDWVEIIVLSAAFVLILFTFVMRLAVVDGPSMENTLHDDEMLIISGLLYTPERNDIIVFNSPNFREPIVKRIIATEGQTVDIDFETWTVTVDGTVLQETYVKKEDLPMKNADVQFPLTVPAGYVFVMGDNRNDSLDSRSSLIGLVDERYILGEVKIRISPFSKFGKVN